MRRRALSAALALSSSACFGCNSGAVGAAADGGHHDAAPPRDGGPANAEGGSDARTRLAQDLVFMNPVAAEGGVPIAPGPATVYEVAAMNLDGSSFRQLTNDGTFKFLPHVSPDGTRIVYTKYATGGYGVPGSHADIAVFDLEKHRESVITHDQGDVQGTWSPDGRRIAYLAFGASVGATPGAIWIVDADGSSPRSIATCPGTALDMMWGDIAWSTENWLLFSVGQTEAGCFKVRTDKIRPDGSVRTKVTDGGPNCTPSGFEQSGDADPGWSHDGKTIYSSRGFPVPPANGPSNATERKLYAFASDAWYPGKPERDLSLPSQPSCIEGVPKGSPDGARILEFRACFDAQGMLVKPGIYLSPVDGTSRTYVGPGFGPDWNPLAGAP